MTIAVNFHVFAIVLKHLVAGGCICNVFGALVSSNA